MFASAQERLAAGVNERVLPAAASRAAAGPGSKGCSAGVAGRGRRALWGAMQELPAGSVCCSQFLNVLQQLFHVRRSEKLLLEAGREGNGHMSAPTGRSQLAETWLGVQGSAPVSPARPVLSRGVAQLRKRGNFVPLFPSQSVCDPEAGRWGGGRWEPLCARTSDWICLPCRNQGERGVSASSFCSSRHVLPPLC